MKINIKNSFSHNDPRVFTWSQVWQRFAVEVATNDVAACFELLDGPNRDDAFGAGDKCFCDYSSCSKCERLCDTSCRRHCSAVVNAAVPCDALESASCSKAFRTRRSGGRRSMVEAGTIDSTRSLQHRHCLIHDFRFLFPFPTPQQCFFNCQWNDSFFSDQIDSHEFIFELWRRVGETAPGNKRK